MRRISSTAVSESECACVSKDDAKGDMTLGNSGAGAPKAFHLGSF